MDRNRAGVTQIFLKGLDGRKQVKVLRNNVSLWQQGCWSGLRPNEWLVYNGRYLNMHETPTEAALTWDSTVEVTGILQGGMQSRPVMPGTISRTRQALNPISIIPLHISPPNHRHLRRGFQVCRSPSCRSARSHSS